MLRKLYFERTDIDEPRVIENIYKSLQGILAHLEKEVTIKQQIIEDSREEIRSLRNIIQDKDQVIDALQNKMADCQRNVDGNRQLINKLLNDIERMQQDIEWYKRTYENRTLFGILKDKLIHLFIK